MNIYKILRNEITNTLLKNFTSLSDIELPDFTIEKPKNSSYGDFSSNVCILFAKILKISPINISDILIQNISHKYIKSIVNINQFLNFNLNEVFFTDLLLLIHQQQESYGFANILHNKELINLEFVSCNPTGPLHIGHMRGAIIGNAIGNLLIKAGFNVTKEYLVNDYGAQIIVLTKSIIYNAIDILQKNNNNNLKTYKPKDFYPGSYLLDISLEIANEFKNEISKFVEVFIAKSNIEMLQDSSFSEYMDQEVEKLICFNNIRQKGVNKMMQYIKADLEKLDIKHDIFFSEYDMNTRGEVVDIIEFLSKNKLIETANLSKPLGIGESDEYISETNYVFRSDLYGDDSPRVIQKANKEITYFASDLAYIKNKINRGFSKLIYILGYDHIGYVKRIQAGAKAISSLMKTKTECEVKVYQMVNYLEGGESVRMSKRAGKFNTVGDVIDIISTHTITEAIKEETKQIAANQRSQHDINKPCIEKETLNSINIYTKNALKFTMLSVKDATILSFDLEKIKEFSGDNIFFYIQYAFARINSVINNIKTNQKATYKKIQNREFDFKILDHEIERSIILLLAAFPYIVEQTISTLDLSKIVKFLEDLAKLVHTLWSFNSEVPYKIISSNEQKTIARVSLLLCCRYIFISSAEILGIQLMERLIKL